MLLKYCSCCFVADIQEFYEITLLDETKSIHQKTVETLSMASKWEKQPPIVGATQLQVSQPLAPVFNKVSCVETRNLYHILDDNDVCGRICFVCVVKFVLNFFLWTENLPSKATHLVVQTTRPKSDELLDRIRIFISMRLLF